MSNNKIWLYKTFFLFSLTLLLLSCGGKKFASMAKTSEIISEDDMGYVAEEEASMSMVHSYTQLMNAKSDESEKKERNDTEDSIERRLIKTGHITCETTDIKKSRYALNTLITKYEAYINNEEEHNSNSRIEINLTIKIPKNNFDSFLAEIENAEQSISSKNIDIQDVTEEFIDITARLAVKKEAEQTYLKLLSTAKTVRDVLDIQDQIQNLRSEIEGIEGRLKYLEKAVAYSTLNIRMYQFIAKSNYLPPRISFLRQVLTSLKRGVNIFADVIVSVLNAWIFVLILLIIVWVFLKKKK